MVQPLIKSRDLELNAMRNYHPVSNLSFLTKVIEKVITSKLYHHQESNNMVEDLQSAYSVGHITETALLKVFKYIVLNVDSGYGSTQLITTTFGYQG